MPRSGSRDPRRGEGGPCEPSEAQGLRLEGLKAEGQQLWIESLERRYSGEAVADNADFVFAEFTILGSGLAGLLPELEAPLKVSLVAGERRTCLENKVIVLGRGALRVQTAPISVRDSQLFPHAGAYRLAAAVGKRDIAELSFRIVDQAELLRQVQVSRIHLAAETAAGKVRREVGALHWDEQVAFQATVRIDTAIVAPNTMVPCSARLFLGARLLHSERHFIRLDQASLEVELQKFSFADLADRREERRTELTLRIDLNGEPKMSWPILILPAEQLANFEGQLLRNEKELSLDAEAAYEEILTRLKEHSRPPKTRSPRN